MTADHNRPQRPPPSQGPHLTTISHDGRFWEVYLELDDDPRRPEVFRGLLCFSPADDGDVDETVRTTVIFIENTFEKVIEKAQQFDDQQLGALLRSALPEK